jgi:hypothetical protein
MVRGLTGYLLGIAITAVIGVGAWMLWGQDILDRVQHADDIAAGGGPENERIYRASNLRPLLAEVKDELGRNAPMSKIVLRPTSLEFDTVKGGSLRALLVRYEPGGKEIGIGRRRIIGGDGSSLEETSPGIRVKPSFPLGRFDVRAPQRIVAGIRRRQRGVDFHLSIATLSRDHRGQALRWTMFGRRADTEAGVAYEARANGTGVLPYDPSRGSERLIPCLKEAAGDPKATQECLRRYQ